MEFTLRDMVYIGVYIATITALFVGFKSRVQKVEKSMDTANKVIFLERGGLNVITVAACSSHRETLRQQTQNAVDQMHCMNLNIVKIMHHMGLEPTPMKPGKITK